MRPSASLLTRHCCRHSSPARSPSSTSRPDGGNRMEVSRADGRSQNQLRPLACSYSVLHRAHGSARWSQGDTIVLAAVYGPKAGTKKNENPERASIEVIWKPMFGPIGKAEKECEMILMRTLRSICLLNVHPNTTTSVIIQVVNDDGALLTCAINAACAALVDASIPLKYLSVAVCCGVTDKGLVMFDPTKIEEEELQATVCLVFPSSSKLVSPSGHLVENELKDNGIITSVTHGQVSVDNYFNCLQKGQAASSKISEFLRKSLDQLQIPSNLPKES